MQQNSHQKKRPLSRTPISNNRPRQPGVAHIIMKKSARSKQRSHTSYRGSPNASHTTRKGSCSCILTIRPQTLIADIPCHVLAGPDCTSTPLLNTGPEGLYIQQPRNKSLSAAHPNPDDPDLECDGYLYYHGRIKAMVTATRLDQNRHQNYAE
jgi:hypothetical protein